MKAWILSALYFMAASCLLLFAFKNIDIALYIGIVLLLLATLFSRQLKK
ncbi:MAG: hypothetical protein J6D36_06825 [Erysipelotrichaceae bacterium]|nr:hypothetical protein [Erysipelotrichaceae bacterium]